MSHNSSSHDVVLKITVPKRTGRKRKRGSKDPWQGDTEVADADTAGEATHISSVARQDDPVRLRRQLQDNADSYRVEASGVIKHTHRFRGLADFYWDMSKSSFAQRYVKNVLPGNGNLQDPIPSTLQYTNSIVSDLRAFNFEPGTDLGPHVDIMPPPAFTHMGLPFHYNYSQNPYVRTNQDGETINMTAIKQVGYFIGADDPTPTGPQEEPDMSDRRTAEALAEIKQALEKRPIWTRRSLINYLSSHGTINNWNELKKYLNYAAYQFKGGPWRDGVVPYGIDPRKDPQYRIYQTVMFKLHFQPRKGQNQSWHSLRREGQTMYASAGEHSHIFDGETYDTDGKVWQICDITDPLLKKLLDDAKVRPACDPASGWYHGGLWAKVKAIMKTKLVAIRFGRQLKNEDFNQTLKFGDLTPTKQYSANIHIPLPKLGLTDEELKLLRGRDPPKKRSQGYNIRLKSKAKGRAVDSSVAPESSPAPVEDETMQSEGEPDEDAEEEASDFVSDNDEGYLDEDDDYQDFTTLIQGEDEGDYADSD